MCEKGESQSSPQRSLEPTRRNCSEPVRILFFSYQFWGFFCRMKPARFLITFPSDALSPPAQGSRLNGPVVSPSILTVWRRLLGHSARKTGAWVHLVCVVTSLSQWVTCSEHKAHENPRAELTGGSSQGTAATRPPVQLGFSLSSLGRVIYWYRV